MLNNLSGQVINFDNLSRQVMEVNTLSGQIIDLDNLSVQHFAVDNLSGQVTDLDNLSGQIIEVDNYSVIHWRFSASVGSRHIATAYIQAGRIPSTLFPADTQNKRYRRISSKQFTTFARIITINVTTLLTSITEIQPLSSGGRVSFLLKRPAATLMDRKLGDSIETEWVAFEFCF